MLKESRLNFENDRDRFRPDYITDSIADLTDEEIETKIESIDNLS